MRINNVVVEEAIAQGRDAEPFWVLCRSNMPEKRCCHGATDSPIVLMRSSTPPPPASLRRPDPRRLQLLPSVVWSKRDILRSTPGWPTPRDLAGELRRWGDRPSPTDPHMGVPDYFDEEVDDDFEALWATLPMAGVRGPLDVFPLFAGKPMKFPAGRTFLVLQFGLRAPRPLDRGTHGDAVRRVRRGRSVRAGGYARLRLLRVRPAPSEHCLRLPDRRRPGRPKDQHLHRPGCWSTRWWSVRHGAGHGEVLVGAVSPSAADPFNNRAGA